MTRPSWDEYFSSIAKMVATRSTCKRKQVGCVLVRDNQIISTGYCGSIKGQPHCIDDDCKIDEKTGGCVAGDTVVSKMQTGRYNTGHRTAGEIVEKWGHQHKKGAMRRMRVRTASGNDTITSGRVTDAWCSGSKPTITVTTRLGRSVTVTPDHMIRVPGGWVAAGDLRPLDLVGLNGQALHKSEVWLRNQYSKPGATITSLSRLASVGPTTVGRWLDRYNIGRKSMSETRWNTGKRGSPEGKTYSQPSGYREAANRFAVQDHCSVCGTTTDLQVHHLDGDHLDGDHTNNSTSNLLTVCVSCHSVGHTPHAKVEAVVYDTVRSVVPAKTQPVFDLTVEPFNNFVGNGFILHNCVRTVHAEMNAIAQAARNGVSTEGATAYTTLSPCYWCFKTMANAGIVRIVYSEQYRIPPPADEAEACGIELVYAGCPT